MKFLAYLAASAAGQTVTVHVRESVSNGWSRAPGIVGAGCCEETVRDWWSSGQDCWEHSFLSLPPGIHNAIAGYGRGEAPIEFDLSPPEEDVRDILGSIDEVARMHEVRESGESLFMTQQLREKSNGAPMLYCRSRQVV